jgi:hypothetical protein
VKKTILPLYSNGVDHKIAFLYNYTTMKSVKIPKKTRAHYVLFANDTPFKPKRVALKTRYQRRAKHRELYAG